MKSLTEFIKESQEQTTVSDSKTFTFKLGKLDNVEDTIKSINELSQVNGVEISTDESTVTLTLHKEGVANVTTIQDILQQYADTCEKTGKRGSSESYALALSEVEKQLNALSDYIDEVNGASDEKNKPETKKEKEDETDNKDKEKDTDKEEKE